MIKLILFIILLLIILIWIFSYNGLVKYKMYTQEAWSQIDVQLKRRNDLIPNLIESVKGYSNFENTTLKEITKLRSDLMKLNSNDQIMTMEISDKLSSGLKSLFAVGEAYPDLKASNEYINLMEELSNTENKIAYSRQLYNTSTANYNIKLQEFPSNIIAKIHKFKRNEFLEININDKNNVNVRF